MITLTVLVDDSMTMCVYELFVEYRVSRMSVERMRLGRRVKQAAPSFTVCATNNIWALNMHCQANSPFFPPFRFRSEWQLAPPRMFFPPVGNTHLFTPKSLSLVRACTGVQRVKSKKGRRNQLGNLFLTCSFPFLSYSSSFLCTNRSYKDARRFWNGPHNL